MSNSPPNELMIPRIGDSTGSRKKIRNILKSGTAIFSVSTDKIKFTNFDFISFLSRKWLTWKDDY